MQTMLRYNLIPVLGISFALRLVAAGDRALWYDEAFSALLSERSWSQIIQGTAADTHPPLYYLMLNLWISLVGSTPLALRMLNILLSMVLIALVGVLAMRLIGKRAVAPAMLLTGCAPFLLYHAQELRMYTLLALGCALYAYGLIRWLGASKAGGEPRWAVAAVGGATIALYSHPLAPMTLVTPGLWLVLQRRWRDLVSLITAGMVASLFYSPWLVTALPAQVHDVQRAYWISAPEITDLVQLLLLWLPGLPVPDAYLPVALAFTVLVVLLLACSTARRASDPCQLYLICFTLVPVVLTVAVSYVAQPVFAPRAIIFSNVAFLMLVAGLIARVRASRRAGLALAAMLLLLAPGLAAHYQYDDFIRSSYLTLGETLRARVPEGELILHDSKFSHFAVHYYDRTLPQQYLPDPPGAPHDTLAPATMAVLQLFPVEHGDVDPGNDLWFVVFEEKIQTARATGAHSPNLRWLDSSRPRLDEFVVDGLRVIHYGAAVTADGS
jgi:mannosyltransferase